MVDEHDELREEWRQIELALTNNEAFAPLYKKYIQKIFRYCYHKIGSQEDARDIAQQVFVKAILNLKSFKNKGFGLSPWLYKIAFNEINDWIKQKNREEFWINNELVWAEMGVIQNVDEEIFDDQMLGTALTKLSEDSLELIRLRYFEKLPFAEVAEILSITESNAKVKVHRTINELRTYITKKN
jgi:RNA polymerase sigma-70 factor (ECF subfamily)